MAGETAKVYGKHVVREALTYRPEVVLEVSMEERFADDAVRALVAKRKVRVGDFKKAMTLVPRDAVHQGVVATLSLDKLMLSYKEWVSSVKVTPKTLVVVADELQDPQNVGSIIRSAAAFGASAVLIPTNNQAPLSGAVIKVSVGMAFRIPLVAVGNVNQTIRDLKDKGFWVYGLAGEGATSLYEESFTAATALIVGNEGEGVRKHTRELCDVLLSIPIDPRCESLNAAVSAAVAMSEWSRQRRS